jgi:phage/plasmid-like protein (TIGR03299 family)
MTDAYEVVQNEGPGEFASALLDVAHGDLLLQAGGAYRFGTRCFLQFQVPDDITIGEERVRRFLTVTWAHDGSQAVIFKPQDYRVECTNQMPALLGSEAEPSYKVRHTGRGLEGKIDEARAALQIMFNSGDKLREVVERWASVTVSDEQFDQVVDHVLPVTDGPANYRRTDERATLHRLWETDANAPIRNTAWGAAQAWVEFSDWHLGQYENEQARALAQLHGSIDTRRNLGVAALRAVLPVTQRRALQLAA